MDGKSLLFTRLRHAFGSKPSRRHQRDGAIRKQNRVCFHNGFQHSGFACAGTASHYTKQVGCRINGRSLIGMKTDVGMAFFPKVKCCTESCGFFLGWFALTERVNTFGQTTFHLPVFPQIEISVCTGNALICLQSSNRRIHHLRLYRPMRNIHIQKIFHRFPMQNLGDND